MKTHPQEPPVAVIYGRVSTDRQERSLDVQDQTCLAYAAAKGLVVPPDLVILDEDTSGRIPVAARSGGRRMLGILEHGHSTPGTPHNIPVKHLVVAKLDRLGRKARDMLQLWDWAHSRGITIHITNLGGDSVTSSGIVGKIVYGVLAVFAEFESDMIQQRIQDAFRDKVAKCEVIGTVPYGWEAIETGRANAKTGRAIRRLVPHPTEQAWLRQMLVWRAAGWSLGRIATELNSQQVPSKTPAGQAVRRGGKVIGKTSGLWQAGNVSHVLNNKHTRRWAAETGNHGSRPVGGTNQHE